MFEFRPEDSTNEEFFSRALQNYADFCNFVKTEDKVPVGLPNTHKVLKHRKFV